MNRQARRQGGAGSNGKAQTNNPIQMMMQARQSGMSPMQFLQSSVQQNPQTQELMKILGGGEDEKRAFAQKIAQAQGIDLNAFLNQMGMN